MKSKNLHFKNYIEQQLLYFSFLPWVIVSLLLFIFAFYDFYVQSKTRDTDIQVITDEFVKIDSAIDEKFGSGFIENLIEYRSDKANVQKIYENYYSLVSEIGFSLSMSIYENDGQVIFSTMNLEDYYFELINLSVIKKMDLDESVVKGSFRFTNFSASSNTYLVAHNIANGNDVFSVILYFDANEIRNNISTKVIGDFAVVDKFDYKIVDNVPALSNSLGKFTHDSLVDKRDFQKIDLSNQLYVYYYLGYTDFWSKYGFTIVVLLMFTLFFHFLLRRNIKNFTKISISSIDELVDNVKEIQDGNLNIDIKLSMFNEFNVLAKQINKMAMRIEKLIQEKNELNIISNEAQIKQLVAQMNPHFLYNSLETIRYLIKSDPDKASEFVFNITKILRFSIDSQKEMIALEEEIAYTEIYLDILKVRFENQLTYHLEMDDFLRDIAVPKLLLQPLIENSIKYGFIKKGTLHINIRIKKDLNNLILIVEDNGGGVEPDRLEEIFDNLKRQTTKSKSFGLYGINRRLRLIYKGSARFYIFNKDDGLRVEIVLIGVL